MKTKMDNLKLINYIEKSSLFSQNKIFGKKILIAYSGGQDSSALLVIFYILSKKWNFELGVVYCNHCWQGSKNNSFAIFEMLKKLRLSSYFVEPLTLEPVKPEQKARNWRYQCFYEIIKLGRYDFLLTGHNLSDSVETSLFHLCRGSGLKGVCSLKEYQIFEMSKKSPDFLFYPQPFSSLPFLKTTFFSNLLHIPLQSKKSQRKTFFSSGYFKKTLDNLEKYVLGINLQKVGLGYHEKLKNKLKIRLKKEQNLFTSVIICFDPLVFHFQNKKPRAVSTLLSQSCHFKTLKMESPSLQKRTPLSFLSRNNKEELFYSFLAKKLKTLKKKQETFFCHPPIQKLAKKKSNEKRVHFINASVVTKTGFQSRPLNLPYQNKSENHFHHAFFHLKKKDLYLIRPLIKIDRETLFLFTKQLNLSIYYDKSNQDLTLTRNYIRKIIIPLLKKINPRLEKTIHKFSKILEFYYEEVGHIECPQEIFDCFHL